MPTHSNVLLPLEHHVLVHFIHHSQAVPLLAKISYLGQLPLGEHFPKWIVRSIDNYRLRLLAEHALQLSVVQNEITCVNFSFGYPLQQQNIHVLFYTIFEGKYLGVLTGRSGMKRGVPPANLIIGS